MKIHSPIVTGSLSVSPTLTVTGSIQGTASFASTASLAQTASYVQLAQTASFVLQAVSASRSETSSLAFTASSADGFTIRQGLTGSSALFTGAITAQTLVVQQVTSSIVYSSGSNIFGNQLTDVQQMTGSLRVTGSGNHYIIGGNVGIGTPSPDSQLVINGSSNSRFNMRAGDVRYGTLYADNGLFAIASITSIPLVFGTNDVERMRITSGGLVGIGTAPYGTFPDSKLHVYGTRSNTINSANAIAKIGGSDVYIGFGALNGTPNYGAWIQSSRYSDDLGFPLMLNPTNSANVLIGTTTDSGYKLDVNGTGRFQDTLYATKAGAQLQIGGGNTLAGIFQSGANDILYIADWATGNNGLRLNVATGNLGLGVTPSAWISRRTAVQVGPTLSISNGSSYYPFPGIIANNVYWDSNDDARYINSSGASFMMINAHTGGNFSWNIAPSGTAGNAITFTQAMTLSADGNLRLGTTSDYLTNGASRRNISINGTSEAILTLGVGDAFKSYFFTNATGTQLVASGSNTVYIGNTPGYLYINSSGNFGIGTTSPGGKLHVDGSGTSIFYVTGNSNTNTSNFVTNGAANRFIVSVNNLENNSQVDFRAHGSTYSETLFSNSMTNAAAIIAQPSGSAVFAIGNYNNGPLVLGTNNAERMRITSGGNVGIGTTSPSSKLEVDGLIKSNRSLGGGLSDGSFEYAAGGNVYTYSDNSYLAVYTGQTERMRVIATGNVGIGTTNPGTKLEVSGSTRITGVLSQGESQITQYASGVQTDPVQNTWYTVYTFAEFELTAFFLMVGFENNNGDGANLTAIFVDSGATSYGGGFSTTRLTGSTTLEAQRGTGFTLQIRTTGTAGTSTKLRWNLIRIDGE